jgi:hypothetical protein
MISKERDPTDLLLARDEADRRRDAPGPVNREIILRPEPDEREPICAKAIAAEWCEEVLVKFAAEFLRRERTSDLVGGHRGQPGGPGGVSLECRDDHKIGIYPP